MNEDSRRGPDEAEPWSACPHINGNDLRCASRFCLGRLAQAYSVCFGSYRACPMYHRLNAEQQQVRHEPAAETAPRISITAHGRALPLRRTAS